MTRSVRIPGILSGAAFVILSTEVLLLRLVTMSAEGKVQLAGIAWDALARSSLSRPANRKRSAIS